MARKGREISSTGMYHILLRGNNGLFFSKKDYSVFLELLKKYFSQDASVFAYCLDKNKIHLVIHVQGNPSDKLKPLCTAYARYINRVISKTGKLFYDRFVSEPIEADDTLINTIRYIIKIPSIINSSAEYTGEYATCNVKLLSESININELFVSDSVTACTDDYSAMSDDELKRLIIKLSGIKNTANNVSALKEYIICTSSSSNLSKSRLFRIFDITGGPSSTTKKQKTPDKTKALKSENTDNSSKSEEAPENNNRKKELSVWLL